MFLAYKKSPNMRAILCVLHHVKHFQLSGLRVSAESH